MLLFVHVLPSLVTFSLLKKLKYIKDIYLNSLRLCYIIDQTGTHTYNASNVVAKNLSSLSKNKFLIAVTLSFPELLKRSSNDECYEDVSHVVETLFTSILIQETIHYMLHKIYVCKKIKPFCKKLILNTQKTLLLKLTKESVLLINKKL